MKSTRLLLSLLALALPGCATHYFSKEWRQWTPPGEIKYYPHKSEPVPNAGSKLDGRWVGPPSGTHAPLPGDPPHSLSSGLCTPNGPCRSTCV